jgi:hypothetical protein
MVGQPFTLELAQTTHPDIAALVDPLFGFAGKRVSKFLLSTRHCER